jgi:hypothetical protein
MSDAPPERSRREAAAAPRQAWPDFAAARAWPEGAPAAVALAHRRDGTRIHVRVEPSALAAYQSLAVDSPMPDGARVVAWHETPRGQLLGGYLLEKRSGAWSAREIDAQGALVLGDAAACLRCHDLAPTDHLFGLANRSAGPPDAAGESLAPPPR